ncbi:hypothetical protein AB0H73_19725 [Streptomyces olivoreticuli]|uniref:hypothetical protein n=1 Tax=Streptomyces olivoreticuli TaxID=68246 RepID=UPI0013C2D788|nr:hypothetical protein [Streptomyces olivoreticuli]
MTVSRSWMRSVALAAVTALVTCVPAPASAHPPPPGQLQCQGTESVTYDPGVTLLPRKFDVRTVGRFGLCVDSAGEVTSGSYGEHFSLSAGCNDLLGGFKEQRTFAWDTGDSSVVEADGSSTAVAGQVVTTITGTVTRGRFLGRTAVQVITLPQPGVLQCLTTGFTGAKGVTTLVIA